MEKKFNFTGCDSVGNEPIFGIITVDNSDNAVVEVQYFGQNKPAVVTDNSSFIAEILWELKPGGDYLNEDRAVCVLQFIIRVLLGDSMSYDRVLIVRTK